MSWANGPPSTAVAVALLQETESGAKLMRHSLQILRGLPDARWEVGALFACMATGMEKITKLTLGLATVEDHQQWPDKATMKKSYGHKVVDLDRRCRVYMQTHIDRAVARPYMRRLLAEVEQDQRVNLILATMARYATDGRFYNLDLLGDAQQPEPAPQEIWAGVEQAVWRDIDGLSTNLGSDDFQAVVRQVNEEIATSVEAWWNLYFRAWIQGIIGPNAKQWSGQISPR